MAENLHQCQEKPMTSFLELRTQFASLISEKRSANLIDVLSKKDILTINRSFLAKRFWTKNSTLFSEVRIVPPNESLSKAEWSLFSSEIGTHRQSLRSLMKTLTSDLGRIIYRNWIPDMFHVVLHSAGIDSRIISYVLKSLHRRFGDEWLGDVVFLCDDVEASMSRQILEFIGWDRSHFISITDPEDEYYRSQLLSFQHVWEHTNGPCSKSTNIIYYLVDEAQKRSYIPEKNIQVWTGYLGNELMIGASGNPDALWNAYTFLYNSHMGTRPFKGDNIVMPYSDLKFLSFIRRSSAQCGEKLRTTLCQNLSPELASFKNVQRGNRRHFSSRFRKRLLRHYKKSWYAHHIKRLYHLPHSNYHDKKWAHFTAASMCDWLITNGYSLRCPK